GEVGTPGSGRQLHRPLGQGGVAPPVRRAGALLKARGGRMARSKKQQTSPEDDPRFTYVPSAGSLEELRERKFFAAWSGYVEPAMLRKARRIVHDLIDELIALQG